MKNKAYEIRKTGMGEIDAIEALYAGVFTAPPWNDDWSDRDQLRMYLADLMGQGNSLAFGLYADGQLVGVSMGQIRHWYTGTEYHIDELCLRADAQGRGLGTRFLGMIESAIRPMGLARIFVQTERTVPAYGFYLKNGFAELADHVSLEKRL